MNPEDYIGKYVDITVSETEGASGWVAKVEGNVVIFDYGFGYDITDSGVSIKIVDPPASDPEPLWPESLSEDEKEKLAEDVKKEMLQETPTRKEKEFVEREYDKCFGTSPRTDG